MNTKNLLDKIWKTCGILLKKTLFFSYAFFLSLKWTKYWNFGEKTTHLWLTYSLSDFEERRFAKKILKTIKIVLEWHCCHMRNLFLFFLCILYRFLFKTVLKSLNAFFQGLTNWKKTDTTQFLIFNTVHTDNSKPMKFFLRECYKNKWQFRPPESRYVRFEICKLISILTKKCYIFNSGVR